MFSVNLKSVCKANKSSGREGLPYQNDEWGNEALHTFRRQDFISYFCRFKLMIGFCLIAVIPKLLSLRGGNELEFQEVLSKFWTSIPVILNL